MAQQIMSYANIYYAQNSGGGKVAFRLLTRVVKESFFIVAPSRQQLTHIVQLIEQQQLRIFVKGVLPLSSAPEAYLTTGGAPTTPGKLVLIAEASMH